MKNKKNQMYVVKIFIALAIVIGILSLYLFYSSLKSAQDYIDKKNVNKNNTQKINFTLTDQKGRKFSSNDLKGHLSLIYFGVTYSLDDNNALKKIEDIVQILKKEDIVQILKKEDIIVQVVFITLDPTYDTSQVLKKYLERIDNNFIGLTGTIKDIDRVADQFKVFYKPKELNPRTGEYNLKHSNFVYLISSDVKFLKHYYLGLLKNIE